jgi:hypothetical protein
LNSFAVFEIAARSCRGMEHLGLPVRQSREQSVEDETIAALQIGSLVVNGPSEFLKHCRQRAPMGFGGLVVAKRKSELVVEEEEKSEVTRCKPTCT